MVRLCSGVLLAVMVRSGTAQLVAPVSQPTSAPATTRAAATERVTDAAHFDAAADYSARYAGRAVLVMIDGEIVFERYDNGWSAERAHPLASGTKSFTGVAAMFAVQDGLLTLDEKACDTITEWRDDPKKREITVRHLLTLSSGLDPADDQLGGKRSTGGLLGPGVGSPRDSRRGSRQAASNLFEAAVGVEMTGEAGKQFRYGPSHFYAFGELLERKLRAGKQPERTVWDYYQARIFEPLGIRFRVGRDVTGHPNLPGGAVLTAREWARFGQFVLQQGAWQDGEGPRRQLLRRDLLAECFEPSRTNPHYGLTWWLPGGDGEASAVADGVAGRLRDRLSRPRQGGGAELPTYFMAAGLGKQRLYIIPARRMVVVRFAEYTRQGAGFDDEDFLRLILSRNQP